MKKTDLLITTGNYNPDIGGPATFLKGFEKYLLENRIKYILIAVVNQNEIVNKENNIILISRRIPFLIRTIFTTALFIYFRFKCKYWLSNTLEIETIITKLVTFQSVTGRIVGDRAWETAVNRGLTEASINDFQSSVHDVVTVLYENSFMQKNILARIKKRIFFRLLIDFNQVQFDFCNC